MKCLVLGLVSFQPAGGVHCSMEAVSVLDKTEFGDVKLVAHTFKFPKVCLGVWLVQTKGARCCSNFWDLKKTIFVFFLCCGFCLHTVLQTYC